MKSSGSCNRNVQRRNCILQLHCGPRRKVIEVLKCTQATGSLSLCAGVGKESVIRKCKLLGDFTVNPISYRMVVVVEWPNTPDCDSGFRGFESRRSPASGLIVNVESKELSPREI